MNLWTFKSHLKILSILAVIFCFNLITFPAQAAQINRCECSLDDKISCECSKKFKISPLATHTYRGYCSWFIRKFTKGVGNFGKKGLENGDWAGFLGGSEADLLGADKRTTCTPPFHDGFNMNHIKNGTGNGKSAAHSKQCTNWRTSKKDEVNFKISCWRTPFGEKLDGKFIMKVKTSGKCLDKTSSDSNGARYHQYTCDGNNVNQLFILDNRQGDWFRIKNIKSNRCVEVDTTGKSRGAAVRQKDCHNGDNQKWKAVSRGGYWYQLQSGNMCLDLASGKMENRAPFQQWGCGAKNPNQLFKLIEVK